MCFSLRNVVDSFFFSPCSIGSPVCVVCGGFSLPMSDRLFWLQPFIDSYGGGTPPESHRGFLLFSPRADYNILIRRCTALQARLEKETEPRQRGSESHGARERERERKRRMGRAEGGRERGQSLLRWLSCQVFTVVR